MHRFAEDVAESDADLRESLSGKLIVITSGTSLGERLAQRLEALKANVVACPCVAICPPLDVAPLTRAARAIDTYNWLAFTSANSVHAFTQHVRALYDDLDAVRVSVAAIGSVTAAVARSAGWTVSFVPSLASGTNLSLELPVAEGQRVLLPRADIALDELPAQLQRRGCVVDDVIAYRTIDVVDDANVVAIGNLSRLDAITFTSPSSVRHMLAAAARVGWKVVRAQHHNGLRVVCIGETTARELQRHSLQPDIVARDQSVAGIVHALATCLRAPACGDDHQSDFHAILHAE